MLQEFAEIFALYLTDFPDAEITFCGTKVDPSAQITAKNVYELEPIEVEGELVPAREVIEWRGATERMLYLCNDQGFPLHPTSPGIQAPAMTSRPISSHLTLDSSMIAACSGWPNSTPN